MDPVELPIPPSVNAIWRTVRVRSGARVTLSRQYRTWRDEAVLKLRMCCPRIETYPCGIQVTIIRGDGWRKGRDGDNVLKPIVDALVKADRIENDSEDYITEFVVRFGPTMKTACVLVSVYFPHTEEETA